MHCDGVCCISRVGFAINSIVEGGDKEDGSQMEATPTATRASDDQFVEATIDIQHLAKFLSGLQVNPQNVLMSLLLFDRAIV